MSQSTTYASFGDIVVVMHDVSCQSKVANLHYLALREQDVPGSQISVDTLKNEKNLLLPTVPHVTVKLFIQLQMTVLLVQ